MTRKAVQLSASVAAAAAVIVLFQITGSGHSTSDPLVVSRLILVESHAIGAPGLPFHAAGPRVVRCLDGSVAIHHHVA